jgi:hypothetical protein
MAQGGEDAMKFYNLIRFVVVLVGLVPWWPRRKGQARGSLFGRGR